MPIAPALVALIALLMAGTTLAQSPNLPGDIEIALGTAQQGRLGLGTTRLVSAQVPDTVEAIGLVLDIGPLAELDAEIEAATANNEASASAAQRLGVLANDDQNASLQTLEAARAQEVNDAARLRVARQRLALEWGTGLATMDMLERRQLIEQVAAGTAALLRIDFLRQEPVISSTKDVSVRLRTDSAHPPLATESLGPAANTDPRMQSSGLLVVVRGEGATGLSSGRMLAAEMDTGRRMAGVVLPRSALVRIEGATWVYLYRGQDDFVRREVVDPRMVDHGWFVSSGFAPGDEVVDSGAGSLLAVERNDSETDDD